MYMIFRCLLIVEKLDGLSFKISIPLKYNDKFRASDDQYTDSNIKLDSYQNIIHQDKSKPNIYVLNSLIDSKVILVK